MKLPFAALILILAIASASCERPASNDDETSGMSATNAKASVKPAKWVMPDSMMQHIRHLERDVSDLESSPEKDHAALAAKIDGHTKRLISSCTMDGEAHDTLHDWLMPFLQLKKDYAAAPDAAAKSAKFTEIRDSLAVFHERFE